MSSEDVLKISTDLGVSTRKKNTFTAALRTSTRNRKLFEPNLKQELFSLNHQLYSFFEYCMCDVVLGNLRKNINLNVLFIAIMLKN